MQILKLNSVQQNNTILLCTVYSSELINVDNIVRIEAMSSYSKIYFSNGKSLVVAKVKRSFKKLNERDEKAADMTIYIGSFLERESRIVYF